MKIRNRGRGKPYHPTPLSWVKEGRCIRCTSHKGDNKGYIILQRNGVRNKLSRLILSRRHKSFGSGLVSRHTCDHAWCINPDHLIPGTYADNNRDKKERGRVTIQLGEDNHSSRLKSSDVITIRNRLGNGETHRAIARDYNVTYQCVGLIDRRKTWKHI